MVHIDTPDDDNPAARRRRNRPQPTLLHVASRPAARAAYFVIGTIGLAALAVAIVGPKRVRREVLEPIRDAVEPRAEKLWAESQPLRDQIAGLLENASPEGRKQLARHFQSWVGHFRAG